MQSLSPTVLIKRPIPQGIFEDSPTPVSGNRWFVTAIPTFDTVPDSIGKRQPMRWTAEGALLRLLSQCGVLDGKLDALFREWYPRVRLNSLAVPVHAL